MGVVQCLFSFPFIRARDAQHCPDVSKALVNADYMYRRHAPIRVCVKSRHSVILITQLDTTKPFIINWPLLNAAATTTYLRDHQRILLNLNSCNRHLSWDPFLVLRRLYLGLSLR